MIDETVKSNPLFLWIAFSSLEDVRKFRKTSTFVYTDNKEVRKKA